MLKKRLFFALFVLCCLVTFAVLMFWSDKNDSAQDVADKTAEKNLEGAVRTDDDSALNLDIKTLLLSQGEGGLELWRLNAEWAKLLKENGLIIVDEPRLVYFMKDRDKILNVRSRKGDIEQKTQVIRFIDSVRVTQDEKTFTGGLLVYNGTQKTMTFPDGCDFTDTGMQARANSFIWFIDQKRITAKGDVAVDFISSGDTTLQQ
ncbi:MAG: LPS export ABC transporter periplasmic protein LptC [Desulfovibrio sp.]|nr:LPS export ABC transporter periplasmic protein LptC [Desulfovibrio sp.]